MEMYKRHFADRDVTHIRHHTENTQNVTCRYTDCVLTIIFHSQRMKRDLECKKTEKWKMFQSN